MEDYSPSHPTDQDAEGNSPLSSTRKNMRANDPTNDIVIGIGSSDTPTLPESDMLLKSPELSPTLTDNSNQPVESLDVATPGLEEHECGDNAATQAVPITDKDISNELPKISFSDTGKVSRQKESGNSSSRSPHDKDSIRPPTDKDSGRKKEPSEKNNNSSKNDIKDRSSAKDKTSIKESDKSYRSNASRSSRNRSRSPRHKRNSRSPDRRSSHRRSSSRPRHSHNRRRSRSKSRDRERRYRRSRSNSRDRRDRRRRDSYRDRHDRRSRSRERNDRRQNVDTEVPVLNRPPNSDAIPLPMGLPNLRVPPPPPMPPTVPSQQVDEQFDMDETSTPDISEDNPPPAQPVHGLNESVAFMLRNRPLPPPPPPPSAPNILAWQQQQSNRSVLSNQLMHNAFPHHQHHPIRPGGFANGFPPRTSHRELPPNLMSQRPTFNPVDRFPVVSQPPPPPPHPQLMTMNGILNPLLSFGGLLGQPPPPPSIPNLPPYSAHQPPPSQFLHHLQQNARLPFPPPPPLGEVLHQQTQPSEPIPPNHHQPQQPDTDLASSSNLLETLMTKAGLPTDGLHGGLGNASNDSTVNSIPLPEPAEDKSPMKKLNKLLNTAANTLLTRLSLSGQQAPANSTTDRGNTPPPLPPPPPPLPMPPTHLTGMSQHRLSMPPGPPFVPPPLPTISNGNGSMTLSAGDVLAAGDKKHRPRLDYNVQEMLAKRRRSEFDNTREWQERIALEVKSFIKPFYAAGRISKEDSRTILKKSVNKVRVYLLTCLRTFFAGVCDLG